MYVPGMYRRKATMCMYQVIMVYTVDRNVKTVCQSARAQFEPAHPYWTQIGTAVSSS